MPKTLKTARRLLIFGLAIYWLVIALGTHLPNQAVGNKWGNDKALHFCAFMGLSVLLSWCFMQRKPAVRRAFVVLSIALLYGVIDEITQVLVPSRSADLFDWFADSSGVVVGLAFYYASLRTVNWISPQRVPSWPSILPIEPPPAIVIPLLDKNYIRERECRKDAA